MRNSVPDNAHCKHWNFSCVLPVTILVTMPLALSADGRKLPPAPAQTADSSGQSSETVTSGQPTVHTDPIVTLDHKKYNLSSKQGVDAFLSAVKGLQDLSKEEKADKKADKKTEKEADRNTEGKADKKARQ